MYFKYILAAVVLYGVVNVGNSANILGVFPMPFQSHHILGSSLLKALSEKGHNVTMVSPFPFTQTYPNYTDIELKRMIDLNEFFGPIMTKTTWVQLITFMYKSIPIFGELVLNDTGVRDLMTSDIKFELLILSFPMTEAFLGLAYHFQAPVILLTTCATMGFTNHISGNINPYSYVPNLMSNFSDEMSFIERVMNTLFGLVDELLYTVGMTPQFRSVLKNYFPTAPPLEELLDRVALTLVNAHFTTESPRPYTPNMIQIGGFHVQEPEPLPSSLKKFLDEAKEGVVYFSFGSNIKISTLPEEKLKIMLKCFSKLNMKVLWKFENDKFPGIPSNVKIEKWLPQKGVLAHPNVKVFITHGGMGSMSESIHAGVPMVAIPFYGDQIKNAADVVAAGNGIHLKFKDLTEQTLSTAIHEVLKNPKYRENVQRMSSFYKDQPIKPMETAMFWVEHVLKHKGAKHLRPASMNLSLAQQLLLDVIAFLGAVLVLAMLLIYYATKFICRLFKKKKSTEKVKTN